MKFWKQIRTMKISSQGVCDEDNTASEKTILANSGHFENIIEVDGCRMKRFLINKNRIL